MDYMIRQFKEKLVQLTNETALPIEVKRMVFNELTVEITQTANNAIQIQMQEIEAGKEAENE